MTYEKIAMVIIFLGVLVAAQIYLYTRSRSNPKMQASIKGLKVISRLNLSKNSQLNTPPKVGYFCLIFDNKTFSIYVNKEIIDECGFVKN